MQVRSRLLFLSVEPQVKVGGGVGGGRVGVGMGVGVKPGRNGYRPVIHDFFRFQVEKGEINNRKN